MDGTPKDNCGWHFTRSRVMMGHRAAGVLPLCFLDGTAWVFLGAEQSRTGPQGRATKTLCKGTQLHGTLHAAQYCMPVLHRSRGRAGRDFGGQREAIDVDVEATASR